MRATKASPKPLRNVKTAGPSEKKTCLLILGMHRSGTSALTRVLNLLGYGLPDRLIGAQEGNEAGHWESENIVLFNDRLLGDMKSSWHDFMSLPSTRLSPAEIIKARQQVVELLGQEYGEQTQIVLKDPRICRFAPVYISALENLGYRVVPIIAFRNPAEVMRSLQKRRSNWPEGLGASQAALLWLRHMVEAEYVTRGMERSFCDYDALMKDWQSELPRLAKQGGFEFPESIKETAPIIEEFLSPHLRHEDERGSEISGQPALRGWVHKAYDALHRLEVMSDSTTAQAALDQIGAAFNAAELPLSDLSEGSAKEIRAKSVELRAQSEENHKQLQMLEAGDQRIVALEQRREAQDQQIAELNDLNAARQTELDAALQRIEIQDRQIAELNDLNAARQAELDTALQRIEIQDQQIRDIDQKHHETAARREECARAEQKRLKWQGDKIDELNALFHDRNLQLDQLRLTLEKQRAEFLTSRSWRVTTPLRGVGNVIRGVRRNALGLKSTVAMLGGVRPTLSIATRVFRNQGVGGFMSRLRQLRAQDYQLTASTPTSSGNYVNLMAAERSHVLFSDWHIALTQAIWDDRPAEQDGATLGLSIVTHNSARWLPGFLTSLLEQGFPLSRLNVAVVDHQSQDNSVDLVQAHVAEFGNLYASFTLHLRPNLGFGAGHDYAIRQLSDDFVLITNVDLHLHHDSLIRTQRAAMADRKDVAAWELRQCPYEHPKYYDPVTLEAVWNSHTCVLFRRHAYLEVGGYDDRIFMYGEDVELSYRFRGFGWRLRYLPQISVTHFVDLDDTTLRPTQLSGSLAANVLLRYRYGGDAAGAEGEALLAGILATERQPARRAGMIEAQTRIHEHREHFQQAFKPTHAADFPFADFDYVSARDGARVAIESAKVTDNAPKVSIITRTHGPKTTILREALAAVINQSYGNIEHLVVEDRTDFARDLVEHVAEAYGREVRYMKSEGAGRSAAGNYGLSQATGELLMFLDNDDLLFCDHVEVLQRKLMSKPDLIAAYALGWEVQTRFDEAGSYREVMHILPPSHRLDFDRERLKSTNFIPIQCILFRRSVYEAEGGFDEEIDCLEDWNLWARYALHGDFSFVPKLTSLYRVPADDHIRHSRQKELDSAYQEVRAKILARYA